MYQRSPDARLSKVRRHSYACVAMVLWGAAELVAQDGVKPVLIADPGQFFNLSAGMEIPYTKRVELEGWSQHENRSRAGFLKNLTIDSFGYGSSPVGEGFEFSPGAALTAGPFTSHELECPRCVLAPTMNRTRYTLPAFGAEATLSFWHDRTQLFTGFGGIETWKPDNMMEPGGHGNSFGYASSFDNAWLLQSWFGGRVAVDHSKHLWLGTTGRYLSNFAPSGRRHWNTFSGNATFVFGR